MGQAIGSSLIEIKKETMNVKTMQEIIHFIKETDISNIPDKDLEKHICSFGLNGEILGEQPLSLSDYYGKGLYIWQYPNQFAPFLKWLSTIKVDSYLEIGCRHGGSFVIISEILKKNNQKIRLMACDLIEESNVLKEYKNYSNFEYIKISSRLEKFKNIIGNNVELVFIDGDHEYDGCYSDWKLFDSNDNTKHIIFHDIDSASCRHVGTIWRDVKKDKRFEFTEFIQQYPVDDIPFKNKFLGIGVLSRKN